MEPAAAAVLVPDALPARGARRGRARAMGRPARGAGSCTAPSATTTSPAHAQARERASGVVALVVTAVLFTTVALVRVERHPGLPAVLGEVQLHGVRGRACPADFTSSPIPSTGVHRHRARLPPGRMFWEGSAAIGAYGTPLALMLLPYWTDGRIASMEGLYYEAAATTPYHFMAAATLTHGAVERGARAPVPHVRRLRPRRALPPDPRRAVLRRHIAAGEGRGRCQPRPASRWRPCPTSTRSAPDGWTIYEVADSDAVAPLEYEPVVVDGLHEEPNWKCEGREPSRRRARRGSPSSARGSASRCRGSTTPTRSTGRSPTAAPRAGSAAADARRAREPEAARCPEVEVVEHPRAATTRSSSTCRAPASPCMVKTSYYPNWEVDGRRRARGGRRRTSWSWYPPSEHVVLVVRHDHRSSGSAVPSRCLGSSASCCLVLLGLGRPATGPNARRSSCRRRPDGYAFRPAPRQER